MKNIMKAQLYQVKKNKFLFFLILIFCVFQVSFMIGEITYHDTIKSAGFLIAGMGHTLLFGALPVAVIITTEFCGADFSDKTMNYELMSGYRRGESFFAKTVLSIVIGILGAMFAALIPFLVAFAAGGFGTELSGGWLLVRFLLLMFPFFTLICLVICLTFIIKQSQVVMGAGIYMCLMIAVAPIPKEIRAYSFVGAFQNLLDFSAWSTYMLVGEKEIRMYNSALEVGETFGMMALCIMTGLLFLWIGYWFYTKDDMN